MPRRSRTDLPPIDLGDQSFGPRLARLRKERGYTQTELGEKIGITQEVVSRYEREIIRLPAEMVVRFATALDVSTDELLGVKPSSERSDPVPPKLRRRMEKIVALEPAAQKALLKTIDIFLMTTKP